MNHVRRDLAALRVRWLALAVALAACIAYGAALTGSYVFDDLHSIASNPAAQDLGNLGRFWLDPSTFSSGLGRTCRPALLSTFALNSALSPAAWSLKAGNVLLHAATSVCLLLWLWRLSRRALGSGLVASWFAVHPLVSEAVNLVSARSELLATFGMLVALHAHLTWQRHGSRVGACCGMVLGAVLACGSKETGVVLPLLCAAQAFWLRQEPLRRQAWRRALLGLVPVVTVVVVYLVARKLLLGQATVQLLGRPGADPAIGHGRSLLVQLATMGTLLPGAVGQMFVPWRLSLDPAVTYRDSLLAPAVVAGWGSLFLVTAAALWPGPSARLRRIGIVFAWAVALPWIVVPLNQPLAEHRLYGPLVGVAAVLAALLPRVRTWLWRGPSHARRAVVAVVAVLLLAATWRSWSRSLLYRDERELWRAELAHHADSFRSWWGLGTSTLRSGDVAGAIGPLARAHELYPGHFDTHRNYAEALVSLPDEQATPDRALAVTAALVAVSPRDPWARTLQAQAELQAGRCSGEPAHFARAEQLALSCLQIATAKGYVYLLAALARRGLGDLPGALAHLDTSIGRGLAATAVRLERAAVLRDLGQLDEARRELARAQREAPLDPAVMQAVHQFTTPAAPR